MLDLNLDLAPELYPLAWLVGKWRGWGTISAQAVAQRGGGMNLNETEKLEKTALGEYYILQECLVKAVGTQLEQSVKTWLAIPTEAGVNVQDDALSGMRNLRRGELICREDFTWNIVQSSPAGDGQEARSRAEIKSQGGLLAVNGEWEAISMGPRVMIHTTALEKIDTEKNITETATDSAKLTEEANTQSMNPLSQMYGLVGGELMWVYEQSQSPSGTGDTTNLISARLARHAPEAGEVLVTPAPGFKRTVSDITPEDIIGE